MQVAPRTRMQVIVAIAQGMPVSRALSRAGYSEKTDGRLLNGKVYMQTVAHYVGAIAEKIGKGPIADELQLMQTTPRWTKEVTKALRGIYQAYVDLDGATDSGRAGPSMQTRSDRHDNGNGARKRPRHSSYVDKSIEDQPPHAARVRQLVERGRNISPEDLGCLGRALLERDLIRPPKDPRTRTQLARTALEAGGVIGSGAGEFHLHQHASLPPVVRLMMESKMREIAGLERRPELSAPVPLPPDPLAGEDKNHG